MLQSLLPRQAKVTLFVKGYRPGTMRRITTIGAFGKVTSKVKVGFYFFLLQNFPRLGRICRASGARIAGEC
jgi:hypothetical protein